MNEGERVLYDISSWSETERRNEMTLKAAFNEWIIYINKIEYESRNSY